VDSTGKRRLERFNWKEVSAGLPGEPDSDPTKRDRRDEKSRESGCERVAMARMKIAILGTRGIPGSYGGFETFAEQLGTTARSTRPRGYWSTAAVITPLVAPATTVEFKLVVLPTIRHYKYFDTIIHTLISVFHSLTGGFDVILDLQRRQQHLLFYSAAHRYPHSCQCRWTGAKEEEVELDWPDLLPSLTNGFQLFCQPRS
jgi:hypothetical protein